MALRRRKTDASSEKWLEVDATMTGTVTFKDAVNLLINGRFEGTLETRGNLSIGAQADVKATLQGQIVSVSGVVNGQIIAHRRVELLASARVTGQISSPKIMMQEGAVLQGTVEMPEASKSNGWMSVEELARYLEVDQATISEWAQSGQLPAQREAGEWRFERTKIEEWLAQERVKSP